jgi:hypothetical protein
MIAVLLAVTITVTPVAGAPAMTDTKPLEAPVAKYLHDANQTFPRKIFLSYSISGDGGELWLRVDCTTWRALSKTRQTATLLRTEKWWDTTCARTPGWRCAVGVQDSCNHTIQAIMRTKPR